MMAYVPAFAALKPGGFTIGFQPRIVPSSVANRKAAGCEFGRPPPVSPEILNPPEAPPAVVKRTPVGVPPVSSGWPGAGMETTSVCAMPAVLYRVETPAPLSESQKNEVADSPMPQG